MSESIRDVANRKINTFSSRETRILYTTIEGKEYTLTSVTFPNENSVKFLCNDLTPTFKNGSNTGFSHSSFDVSERDNYFNTASLPTFTFKTWKPTQTEINFWNNLSFRNPNVNGGRRKKSRAKKSRKNRRTRRS